MLHGWLYSCATVPPAVAQVIGYVLAGLAYGLSLVLRC